MGETASPSAYPPSVPLGVSTRSTRRRTAEKQGGRTGSTSKTRGERIARKRAERARRTRNRIKKSQHAKVVGDFVWKGIADNQKYRNRSKDVPGPLTQAAYDDPDLAVSNVDETYDPEDITAAFSELMFWTYNPDGLLKRLERLRKFINTHGLPDKFKDGQWWNDLASWVIKFKGKGDLARKLEQMRPLAGVNGTGLSIPAAMSNRTPIIEALLDTAHFEQEDIPEQVLHAAALHDSFDVVKMLLRWKGRDGRRALLTKDTQPLSQPKYQVNVFGVKTVYSAAEKMSHTRNRSQHRLLVCYLWNYFAKGWEVDLQNLSTCSFSARVAALAAWRAGNVVGALQHIQAARNRSDFPSLTDEEVADYARVSVDEGGLEDLLALDIIPVKVLIPQIVFAVIRLGENRRVKPLISQRTRVIKGPPTLIEWLISETTRDINDHATLVEYVRLAAAQGRDPLRKGFFDTLLQNKFIKEAVKREWNIESVIPDNVYEVIDSEPTGMDVAGPSNSS